jgi:hypothetical protein
VEIKEEKPIEVKKEEILPPKVENNSGNSFRDIKPNVVTEVKQEVPVNREVPRFEPPKTEVVLTEAKKPVFIRNEETKVPQPPQLNKNPKPIFEANPPTPTSDKSSSGSPSLENGGQKNTEDNKKINYDDLFGNGIV